jgi:hypothetical protein
MNLVKLAGLLVLAFTLASCGTVFNSGFRPVSFTSEPAGAKVLLDGKPIGTTPCQVDVNNHNTLNLEYRLEGYEPRTVTLDCSVGAGWVVLDIIPGFALGIIPFVVDAASGNWRSLDQEHVHAVLLPATPAR